MVATIQFKRGLEAGIPTLSLGEPGFCTDSGKLFVGKSGGNFQIGGAGGGGTGTGSVTSVGISGPAGITWAPAAITTSGVFSGSWSNQGQSTVLAGPVSGAAAPPTFRPLEAGDFNNVGPNLVAAGPPSGGAVHPSFRSLVTADLPTGTGGAPSTYYGTDTSSALGFYSMPTLSAGTTTSAALSVRGNPIASTQPTTDIVAGTNYTVLAQAGTGFLQFVPVSNNYLGNHPGYTILGNTGSSTGVINDITAAQDFQVLRRSGGSVAFGAVNLQSTNAVSGTLPAGNGGTSQTNYATGDLLFGNAAGTLNKLAIGTTGYVLNVASGIPHWVDPQVGIVSHPGTAKAWVILNGAGTISILQSYNVLSITDGGVGVYTVNYDVPFIDSDYVVAGTTVNFSFAWSTRTPTSTIILNRGSTAAFIDGIVCCVAFGYT